MIKKSKKGIKEMPNKNNVSNVVVENAQIIFRNFAGKEGTYNPAGRRTYSVVLEEDVATDLMNIGWNVKPLKKRDDDEPQRYHLPVRVKYGDYPPKIYLVTKRNKTLLTEDEIETLDYAEIDNVDVVIRPYCWTLNDGKSGITAYTKEMYVTIVEDTFADKYADDPDEIPFN